MYPFSDGEIYVRNAWYMAAWGEEVTDQPLGRTIMDEPIVLFRTSQGDVKAIWGICAHRYYPLAEAEIVNDNLVCPYHGFTYDGTGACVYIPAQDNAPENFKQKTYPIIEKFEAIWIWMGDQKYSDIEEIPRLDSIGFGVNGWRALPNGRTYIKARWPLLVDNLMDLSHVGFLHKNTIQQPDAGEAKPIFEGAPEFRCVRWLLDQNPDTPYYRWILPDNTEPLDGELDTRFFGPGIIITSLIIHSAESRGDRTRLATVYHLHGITPETSTTTHDFSAVTRDANLNSKEFDEWQKKAAHAARVEDVDALEKIEPIVARYGKTHTELSGIGDMSGRLVRRHLSKLMQAEAAPKKC